MIFQTRDQIITGKRNIFYMKARGFQKLEFFPVLGKITRYFFILITESILLAAQ